MATLHLITNYCVPGDLVDVDTDILQIEVPDPSNAVINKIMINSLTNASGTATIEVRSAADGGGNGIVVTFSTGENFQTNTGSLDSLSTYIYIHNGTPGGLSNVNCTIRYNY